MAEACVFCGKLVGKKTKEHVIPRWLMRMAGNNPLKIWTPLKSLTSGCDEVMQIDQDDLHFPACNQCNNADSALEDRAKVAFTRLMREEPLSVKGCVSLLDWFDKVRIGLWLGMQQLQNDPFRMPVNFHINDRLGKKDRAVCIYKIADGQKGWGCLGTSTPSFHKHPGCFTLSVNSIYLLNLSTDFFLARNMGLPYPREARILSGGKVEFGFVEGQRRLSPALISYPIAPGCVQIIQPSVRAHLQLPLLEEDKNYVDSLLPSNPNAIGRVYVSSNDTLAEVTEKPTQKWSQTCSYQTSDQNGTFLRQTLMIQNEMNAAYSTDDANALDDIDNSRRFNQACIDEIDRRSPNRKHKSSHTRV